MARSRTTRFIVGVVIVAAIVVGAVALAVRSNDSGGGSGSPPGSRQTERALASHVQRSAELLGQRAERTTCNRAHGRVFDCEIVTGGGARITFHVIVSASGSFHGGSTRVDYADGRPPRGSFVPGFSVLGCCVHDRGD